MCLRIWKRFECCQGPGQQRQVYSFQHFPEGHLAHLEHAANAPSGKQAATLNVVERSSVVEYGRAAAQPPLPAGQTQP
jgi:hypothetical protein